MPRENAGTDNAHGRQTKENNEQLYQQRSPSEHPHIELRDSMHHRNLGYSNKRHGDGQHQTYCERYQCQRDGYRQPRNQQFREGTMMIPNSLSSMMRDPHIRPAFVGSARIMQIR